MQGGREGGWGEGGRVGGEEGGREAGREGCLRVSLAAQPHILLESKQLLPLLHRNNVAWFKMTMNK